MYRQLWMFVGAVSLASFGCAGRGSSSASQQGRISLAIASAPQDATCIQVLVNGSRSVERDVDVTPGQSTVLLLDGLPEGTDTITVNAYAGNCSMLAGTSIPTWVGDPVVVAVTPDPVEVMITLHRNNQNGRVSIGVNFEDDGGPREGSAGGGGGGAGGSGGVGGSSGAAGSSDTDGGTGGGAAGNTGGTAGSGGTDVEDAGVSTGGGGAGGGGTADSGGSDICLPLHSDPATCFACEDLNCPHDATGCPDGCNAQPACGDYASEAPLCDAVLTCIRTSNCIEVGVAACYCGTATLTACKDGSGDGACKSQIEAGMKTTNPTAILLNLTNVRLPGGGAMSLGQCDHDTCGAPAAGGNNECLPYCK